ncbi:MAG: AAA family ATPase [Candidatus Paceibacterota bacterium]|jgi:thymidylate kinase
MFIVLEGIDGSGKSSLAPMIAAKCNGTTYATPPEKYRRLRKQIDTDSSPQKHYEFYRDAVTEASSEISKLLSSGETVVCDRYWFSTLVYHRAGKMVLDGSDFSHLTQPDLTVLLLVGPEEQVRRYRKRGVEGGNNVDGFQVEINNLYRTALIESKLPFIVIDTDHYSLEQITDMIVAALPK